MNFPNSLNWEGREIFPKDQIRLKHFMYARHKPGSDWKEGDEYPDFSKIRSTQSFNWSAFSLPIWVRFNDQKEYNSSYGVIGYSVNTIRNTNKVADDVPSGIFDIKHEPVESNYSHCELFEENTFFDKKQKRAFRLALINGCSKELLPNSDKSRIQMAYDWIRMHWHRFQLRFLTE